MKILGSRRRVWAAAAAVLLVLFVLRPGASRLKVRIASSIAAALGRSVEIGSVHIRLLPQPGFDLENLVVYDGPAFGSEPLLRAPEVAAVLRLTSLIRGRLEIARLDLTDPSLNLVHSDGGRWNLEVLLERAAHSPLAPTGKAKSEPRPAFPYIQATSGRINFKFGQEKKPYALTNADFSLWQDSENSWGVRLKAQPFRSDLTLNDTGLLAVNGTWQRAENLRDTPLNFTVQWDRPQLGQLTKFFTGGDKGWRGGLQLTATLTGTPQKMQVSADGSIRDFRRYDILSGEPVGLAAHCDGQYSSVDRMLRELFCRAPVGDGSLVLRGEVGLPGSRVYDVALTAENVPASSVAAAAQRAKKNLPADLLATGVVQANFSMRREAGDAVPAFEGRGQVENLRLSSAVNKADVTAVSVPILFTNTAKEGRLRNPTPPESRLEIGPVTVPMGRPAPAMARGWISRTGFEITFAGQTEIGRALRAAHLFGVPALTTAAEGAADVDLQIAGSWADWEADHSAAYLWPKVEGTARLRGVTIPIRGTNSPIEISRADLQLSPEEVIVSRLAMKAAHSDWTGSVDLPRGCGTPAACIVHFNLNANEASLSDFRQWAAPNLDRPWYRALTTAADSSQSFFANLRAAGKLTINRLVVQHVVATHVLTNVNLDAGKLRLSDLRGDLLGGSHRGEWEADFTHRVPAYSGTGTLTQVSLGLLADAMNDPWVAGFADGRYQVTASGSSTADFWRSADSSFQVEVRDGSLPHLSLTDDGDPVRITQFEGRAHLNDRVIEFKDAALNSNAGDFLLSGTAGLNRELNFKLKPVTSLDPAGANMRTYTITGTLAQPQASPGIIPDTQAQLKP